MNSITTTYETIGGELGIRQIVERFYPKVQRDSLLGPLFPDDITAVMEKQVQFLTQFFGGPTLYSDLYGHPMMRARHMPFAITERHAQAWLRCMGEALMETELPTPVQQFVLERLSGPAYHFINTSDESEK
jgi:hemoglobin